MDQAVVEEIARYCHEANRGICIAQGDNTQHEWGRAPQWQRDSAIIGVKFCIDNPDAPPSANHESWLREKAAQGWKYGRLKDEDSKLHPCFVPYDQLPPSQRVKDHVFKAIVAALVPPQSVPSEGDARTVNNDVRHTYRVLSDLEKKQMVELKDLGLAFLNKCDEVGQSRELALAKTNAEQAVMWAVKHVTR